MKQADSVLIIHAPTAIVSSAEIAAALAPVAQEATRNVIGCWLGGDSVAKARSLFAQSGIPTYDTPEDAVHAFMQIVQYRRNQDLLMEVPPSVPEEFVPGAGRARQVIRDARASGRVLLSQSEVSGVLQAYGIPFAETRIAANVDEAVKVAQLLGFPVAIKVLSPDISHKSDVGGVALDLATSESVRTAAQTMYARCSSCGLLQRFKGSPCKPWCDGRMRTSSLSGRARIPCSVQSFCSGRAGPR